jgi:hypothetical protein
VRPMALRNDKRVLCLDGRTLEVSDILLASGLEQGGLFVVRSSGGDISVNMALADVLLAKEAAIIVNDYCVAVCANYLFIASIKTFVPKGALVAWNIRAAGPDSCIQFIETRDSGAPRLQEQPCAGPFRDARTEDLIQLKKKFFDGRLRTFEAPPESVAVRRILKRKFDVTGKYPDDAYWTWNPRYHASSMRAKVLYEAYPQSQDEVDAIVARVGMRNSVIYDP